MKFFWYLLCLLVIFVIFGVTEPCDIKDLANSVKDYAVKRKQMLKLEYSSSKDRYPLLDITLILNHQDIRQYMIVCLHNGFLNALDLLLKYREDGNVETTGELREELLHLLLSVLKDKYVNPIWDHYFNENRMVEAVNSSGDLEKLEVPTNLVGTFELRSIANKLQSIIFLQPGSVCRHNVFALFDYVQRNPEFLDLETNEEIPEGKFKMRVLLDFYKWNENWSDMTPYPELLVLASLFKEDYLDEDLTARLKLLFIEFYAKLQYKKALIKELVGIKPTSTIFRETAIEFFRNRIDTFVKPLILAIVEKEGKPYVLNGGLRSISECVSLLLEWFPKNLEPAFVFKDMFESLLALATFDPKDASISKLDAISYAISAVLEKFRFTELPEACFVDGHLRGSVFYTLARNTSYPGPDLQALNSPATCAEVFSIPGIEHKRAFFNPNVFSPSSLGKLIDPRATLEFLLTQEPLNFTAIINIFSMFQAEDNFELTRGTRQVTCEIKDDDEGRVLEVKISSEEQAFSDFITFPLP